MDKWQVGDPGEQGMQKFVCNYLKNILKSYCKEAPEHLLTLLTNSPGMTDWRAGIDILHGELKTDVWIQPAISSRRDREGCTTPSFEHKEAQTGKRKKQSQGCGFVL